MITAEDALAILKILADGDTVVSREIEQVTLEYLRDVDIDGVSEEVFFGLDCIDVEDVYDRSGSMKHGYVDPADAEWEVFEEALEPYMEKMTRYQELSMHVEAKKLCMGTLKGILRFEEESTSEYRNLAVDAPGEYLRIVLCEWKKGCPDPGDIREVEKLID